MIFKLTETREDVTENSGALITYSSNNSSPYFLKRTAEKNEDPLFSVNLNQIPLAEKPVFGVMKTVGSNDSEGFLITISLLFKVENKTNVILVPVQTSVVSRVFQF